MIIMKCLDDDYMSQKSSFHSTSVVVEPSIKIITTCIIDCSLVPRPPCPTAKNSQVTWANIPGEVTS